MGNQQSMSSSDSYKAYVPTFVAPDGKMISAATEVELMTGNIKQVLAFHTSLHSVFNEVRTLLPKFVHKISNGKVINFLVPQREKENTRLLLNFLFNLGVFKSKIRDNEHIYIAEHPNFATIHSKLIENLTKLAAIQPITSAYSVDTVDEESIKKQFENNLKTINGVMARVIFYKYCIIFNNYLMHIYAIYAQSQFEVFESNVIKQKKQAEFSSIQKALSAALSKTNTNYNINLSNSLNALNKKITKGGATSNTENKQILSNIQNIQNILYQNFQQFNASNKNTMEFFNNVNLILDNKMRQIIAKYAQLNLNEVLNKNILNALKSLETSIMNHHISPTSENLDMLVNNLTNDEREKQLLRNYLQVVSIQANAIRLNLALQNQPQPQKDLFVNASDSFSQQIPEQPKPVPQQTPPGTMTDQT